MQSVSFNSYERLITAEKLATSIKWNIALPRTNFVVRDFLLGNYLFEASIDWHNQRKAIIGLSPSNISMFDESRKF